MKSDLSWLPGPEHETFLGVWFIDLVDIILVKQNKKQLIIGDCKISNCSTINLICLIYILLNKFQKTILN